MKRERIYLDKTNFIKSILEKNGYFCEHLPFCFSTNDLSNKWDKLSKKFFSKMNIGKNDYSTPILVSMKKDDFLRRQICIPNFVFFLNLAKIIENNYSEIKNVCKSTHSESPIKYIADFDYPSDYKLSIRGRNKKFTGYIYKLKLDISNCYNSIYTHSITWGMVGGKDIGKKMYQNKALRSFCYNIGDELDRANEKLNSNQTNGILTGPFTSRVMSEIILATIDKELHNSGFNFVRYVDDYNFYFSSNEEAQSSISKIAKILYEYNLLINHDKISIEKFPFDRLDDFNNEFNLEKNNYQNVYQALQKAFNFTLKNKNLGALKYLLKALDGKELALDYYKEIFGLLLNTMLAFPLLSPYVVKVIKFYLPQISYNITNQLNLMLRNELKAHHDHESLWILYLILESKTKIRKDVIASLLNSNNDLIIIMCLDYINNNLSEIKVEKLKKQFDKINSIIDNVSMKSQHWLLAYTISKLNLRINNIINAKCFENDKIYELLINNDINFYKSFYELKA